MSTGPVLEYPLQLWKLWGMNMANWQKECYFADFRLVARVHGLGPVGGCHEVLSTQEILALFLYMSMTNFFRLSILDISISEILIM